MFHKKLSSSSLPGADGDSRTSAGTASPRQNTTPGSFLIHYSFYSRRKKTKTKKSNQKLADNTLTHACTGCLDVSVATDRCVWREVTAFQLAVMKVRVPSTAPDSNCSDGVWHPRSALRSALRSLFPTWCFEHRHKRDSDLILLHCKHAAVLLN